MRPLGLSDLAVGMGRGLIDIRVKAAAILEALETPNDRGCIWLGEEG